MYRPFKLAKTTQGKYESAYEGVCKSCKNKVGFTIKWASATKYSEKDIKYHVFVGECPTCGFMTLCYATQSSTPDVYIIKEIHPALKIKTAPEFLPDKFKATYNKIAQLAASNQTEATVLLTRSLLEAITKDFNCYKGNLKASIEELYNKHIIPETLKDAAEAIRLYGNDAAHEVISGIENETATLIFEFLNILIDYLYVLPAKTKTLLKK